MVLGVVLGGGRRGGGRWSWRLSGREGVGVSACSCIDCRPGVLLCRSLFLGSCLPAFTNFSVLYLLCLDVFVVFCRHFRRQCFVCHVLVQSVFQYTKTVHSKQLLASPFLFFVFLSTSSDNFSCRQKQELLAYFFWFQPQTQPTLSRLCSSLSD